MWSKTWAGIVFESFQLCPLTFIIQAFCLLLCSTEEISYTLERQGIFEWAIPLIIHNFFCLASIVRRQTKEKMLLSVNRHLIDMSNSPLTTADGINVLLWLCISKETAYYVGPLFLHTYSDKNRDRKREKYKQSASRALQNKPSIDFLLSITTELGERNTHT